MERNAESLIKSARVSKSTKRRFLNEERRNLPHLDVIAERLSQLKPGFHFTADSFIYHPDDDQSRTEMLKYAGDRGWGTAVYNRAIMVRMRNIERITQDGLRAGSYTAHLSDENWELVRGNGALLKIATENLVSGFGKHAMPYKLPVFNKARGYITHVNSGAVVLKDTQSLQDVKDEVPGQPLTNQTILNPRTAITTVPVLPGSLLTIPIRINKGARVDGQQLRMRFDDLHREIASSLVSSLPELASQAGFSDETDEVVRYAKHLDFQLRNSA